MLPAGTGDGTNAEGRKAGGLEKRRLRGSGVFGVVHSEELERRRLIAVHGVAKFVDPGLLLGVVVADIVLRYPDMRRCDLYNTRIARTGECH